VVVYQQQIMEPLMDRERERRGEERRVGSGEWRVEKRREGLRGKGYKEEMKIKFGAIKSHSVYTLFIICY
jgi:hypothetical protein